MLDWLKEIDIQVFFLINGCNSLLLDKIMMVVTGVWVWIPLYALVTYLVIKKFKKDAVKIVVACVVMIVLSDQGANLIKKSVKRYRPSHNIEIGPQVHTVDGYLGGQYGFVSSHSSNVFAFATFLSLLFANWSKSKKLTFFLWATLVAYSRIYLGVHYPLDIIGGALLGVVIAYLVFYFLKRFMGNYQGQSV